MAAQSDEADILQIDENMAYQRVFWIIQRAWWAVLAIALVLAVLGVFGSGPLSSTTASQDTLEVDYERFLRRDSASVVRLRAPAPAGEFEVTFNRAYIDRMVIDGITPEPGSVVAGASMVSFIFTADGGGAPVSVAFQFRPNDSGRLEATIGAAGETVGFTQYVYP